MFEDVEDKHIDIFCCLADGVVHETTPENIRPYLDPSFPEDKIDLYCSKITKPSDMQEFRDGIKNNVMRTHTKGTKMFVLLMNTLDSRILAPALTGTLKLIRDMDYEELEALLVSWRDSNIPQKRRLFKLVYGLTVTTFIQCLDDLHNEAIGFPNAEKREKLYNEFEPDEFRYTMMEHPADGSELYLPVDALIVGSGSGAGVVAETLSNRGFKCVVLEKGKYYHPSEYKFKVREGMQNLYENNGVVATTNQQLFLLAGSTFGGGSTVNWSACLKTPFKVRMEWFEDHKIDWAATDKYDKDMEYVLKKMHASDENIDHSYSNQVILDGGSKLGYNVAVVPQNNGGHPNHDCGFCFLGCKHNIKQGSAACWFRDAAKNGTQFMDQVKVRQVLHKRGKAYGVLCEDLEGRKFKITGPKKIIMCGGSLNTPVVLQNSGFKNKHIGSNLKLHPVTVLTGQFPDQRFHPYDKPIMTAVCTQVDDLDGKAHGAKIETMLHTPHIEAAFLPWRGSDDIRKELLGYNNTCSMLLITRDTSSGTIRNDPARPDALVIDYSLNKFDRQALLEAMAVTADMLYIKGVQRIIPPQAWSPSFTTTKPVSERLVNDKDYQEWKKKLLSIPLSAEGPSYGSAHQMSSCRISGKGPSDGACDTRGRLYECGNIYVADASAMPTASGANPMISTMSIARRIALGIADDLEPQSKL